MPGMRYQPQGLCRIATSNPLCRGISVALNFACRGIDSASGKPATLTGVRQGAPSPVGLSAGFGATHGIAASDRVTGLPSVLPQQRSYFFLLSRKGGGGSGLGRLFEKGAALEVYQQGGTLRYARTFSGGVTSYAASGISIGTEWRSVGIVHDESAPSNAARFYQNGLVVPNDAFTPSSGTAVQNANPLVVANRAAGDRGFDGHMALVLFWDRLLSDDEMRSVAANPWQLFIDPNDEDEFLAASSSGDADGSLSSSLGDASMSASGAAVNAGTFSATLSGAVLSSSGSASLSPSGSFSTSLSGVSFSATGALLVAGSMSATLEGAQSVFSGNVAAPATGALAASLDGASMNAYGYEGAAPMQAPNRRYRPRILRRHFQQ